MTEEPAFSHIQPYALWKRVLLGILCAGIACGVIFGVCYILEVFKRQAKDVRMTMEQSRVQLQQAQERQAAMKRRAKPAVEPTVSDAEDSSQ